MNVCILDSANDAIPKKEKKEKKLHRGSQILTIDQMEERAQVNLLHKAVILGPRELKLLCVPQPSTNDTSRRCLLVVPSNPKRQSRSGHTISPGLWIYLLSDPSSSRNTCFRAGEKFAD